MVKKSTMKTTTQIIAALGSLITGLFLVAEAIFSQPPTSLIIFLFCLAVVQILNVCLQMELFVLKEQTKPEWFYVGAENEYGYASERDVVEDAVHLHAGCKSPFVTEIGRATTLPPIFAAVHFYADDENWDFETFDTEEQAEIECGKLESEAA